MKSSIYLLFIPFLWNHRSIYYLFHFYKIIDLFIIYFTFMKSSIYLLFISSIYLLFISLLFISLLFI